MVVGNTNSAGALGRPVESALRPAGGMVNELRALDRPFEGIEHEACMGGSAAAPADDPSGISAFDERHIGETLPGGGIGEIVDPEHVRRRHPELPIHLV